ncbi:MAG: hypothetical protein O6945_03950 [Gammaproteobacteria bacterium]|nr:hypothetical protein [Gammaproteobacteria bacterium]
MPVRNKESGRLVSNQLNKKFVRDFWKAQESASAEELPEVIAAVAANNIKWFGPEPIIRMKSRE